MADSMNRWDSSEYNRQMSAVKKAANAYSEWIDSGLTRTEVVDLSQKFDFDLKKTIDTYKSLTVRLNNLYTAMKTYLADYENMLANAERQMDQVQETESAYGSFGNIFAGVSTTAGSALAGSIVYQFGQTGKTFSADYNDMTAFMNSDVYGIANGFQGLSQINNWEMYYQSISSAVTGEPNEYVEDLLRSSLKSMVEGIPGSEPVSFSNLDWDVIGQKLGIENLRDYMWPVSSILKDISEGTSTGGDVRMPSEGDIKKLNNALSLAKEMLKGVKGSETLVTILGGFGDFLKKCGYAGKLTSYASELFANYFNTYADQISYLETMKTSLESAGYWTGSPVVQQIDELLTLYNDKVAKTWEYTLEEVVKGEAIGIGKEALTKSIPVLKEVDTFFGVASKTSMLYGTDRVKAASALMGCCQYDNVLTETYEKYAALVESGAAATEEIAQADRLFDMVYAMKKTEYESMKTIAKDYNDYWYNMANKKLNELQGFKKEFDCEQSDLINDYYEYKEHIDKLVKGSMSGKSTVGSSGGGWGGGGQRG